MTSNLYSRYVPPKKKKVAPSQVEDTATLPASKLMLPEPQPAPLEYPPLHEVPLPRPSIRHTSPSSPSSAKRKAGGKDGQLEEQPHAKRSKGHKSLLEKRDKSAEKSKKLKITSENAELEETKREITALESQSQPDDVHPLQPIPQPKSVSKSVKNPVFSALPSWLADPLRVSATITSPFTELGIPQHVSKALKDKGFDHAFAVQTVLIPLLLPGDRQSSGDILVSAATGSGKTLGYVLPIISDISRTSVTRLRGLIIVPTRDLVYQAYELCEICASAFAGKGRRRIKVGMACGDSPYKQEVAYLMSAIESYNPAEYQRRNQHPMRRWDSSDCDSDDDEMNLSEMGSSSATLNFIWNHTSKVDILICTPGRLVQHLHSTEGFEVNHVQYLVIDEADRLFGQAYQGWLKDIMTSLGKGEKRRITKILLSATVTQDLSILSSLNLESPRLVYLDVGQGVADQGGADVQERFSLPESLQIYYVKLHLRTDKPIELMNLFKEKNLLDNSSSEKSGVLVFTNSNEAALRLCRLIKLMDPDISVGTLTSTMPASDRKKTLRKFQLKKLSVVVASDLVGRGLDIPSLAHVVNYDFPTTVEKFIHRVGRTARAGKSGKAWTLHTAKELQNGMLPGGETVVLPEIELEMRTRYEAALAILAKEAGRA